MFEGRRYATSNYRPQNAYSGTKAVPVVVSVEEAPGLMAVNRVVGHVEVNHQLTRLRDEFLDGEIFYTLNEAQVLIEAWRCHYNTIRPHGSLGYRPPAPAPQTVVTPEGVHALTFNPDQSMWAGQHFRQQSEYTVTYETKPDCGYHYSPFEKTLKGRLEKEEDLKLEDVLLKFTIPSSEK